MSSDLAAIAMARPVLGAPRSNSASAPAHHQYACLRCRSRRVKCDKILSGCANCNSHRTQCLYSARRPRKAQKSSPPPGIKRQILPRSPSPRSFNSFDHGDLRLGNQDSYDYVSRAAEPSDDEEDAVIHRELRDTVLEARGSDSGSLLIGPQGECKYVNKEKAKQVNFYHCVTARPMTRLISIPDCLPPSSSFIR